MRLDTMFLCITNPLFCNSTIEVFFKWVIYLFNQSYHISNSCPSIREVLRISKISIEALFKRDLKSECFLEESFIAVWKANNECEAWNTLHREVLDLSGKRLISFADLQSGSSLFHWFVALQRYQNLNSSNEGSP